MLRYNKINFLKIIIHLTKKTLIFTQNILIFPHFPVEWRHAFIYQFFKLFIFSCIEL